MKSGGFVVLIITLFLLASCNQSELNNLESQISRLEDDVFRLENQVRILEDENINLRRVARNAQTEAGNCQTELLVCQQNFENYKYGNGVCITRYIKDRGRATICGADNIIDVLGDGYCPYNCR